jgi:hypothetical protein
MSRLPSRPLYDAAAYVAGKPLHAKTCRYCGDNAAVTSGCVKAEELARLLGVSRKTVTRWTKHGIPLRYADQLATRLGYNPIAVWGLWWDDPEYLSLVDN